ncbi:MULTISPECIES: Imm10 family immunity protein [Acinetobacter]|uniref:Immunity protein 10 n=1 Tax=Acinetobacter higginsii TaxID=70347 RepID=N9RKV7_9GAMM|nr:MULTISPECIES: Imm10 family immunity protein [Acinetobacter]ENX58598.1 hypothetical protein F902_02999 [Acinetobacter higginsii]MCH7305899.1 Imm10 family immunity protein [Acinetobacter higginsii]
MKLEFIANDVNYFFEDGIHILGFADNANEPQEYVIFERSIEFDEQDRKLGQDTYFVEVCADGSAGYGGIRLVSFLAGTLKIEFEEDAKWCGELSFIQIDIQLIKDYGRIKDWLLAIFSKTDTLVEFESGKLL